MNREITPVGLGSTGFDVAIYIANRPDIDHYSLLGSLQPMERGEVAYICARTSNHWRKVFNVYAKFIFELRDRAYMSSIGPCLTWQEYRDSALLQAHCRETLLFSAPQILDNNVYSEPLKRELLAGAPVVHIIAGKTYAQSLKLPFDLQWQDSYFAINKKHRVIVSPYLDYRQLSNARITQLVGYVKALV